MKRNSYFFFLSFWRPLGKSRAIYIGFWIWQRSDFFSNSFCRQCLAFRRKLFGSTFFLVDLFWSIYFDFLIGILRTKITDFENKRKQVQRNGIDWEKGQQCSLFIQARTELDGKIEAIETTTIQG